MEDDDVSDVEECLDEQQKAAVIRRDEFRNELEKNLAALDIQTEEMTGILTTDAFMKLRGEITAHTFLVFEPIKQILMKGRLAAFKKQNWDIYTAKINEASQAFYGLSHQEMEFALQYLDISVENYMISLKKIMVLPGI